MHEVWSQELQCYRTRNASKVRLKYAFIYVQWELLSVWSLGFLLRPYTATVRKPNASLADQTRRCPFTQRHSGVFRLLVVFILRFVRQVHPLLYHSPIFGRIQRRKKKLNWTVPCSNFLSNNSGIVPILLSSESLRLDLSFLEVFNRSFFIAVTQLFFAIKY